MRRDRVSRRAGVDGLRTKRWPAAARLLTLALLLGLLGAAAAPAADPRVLVFSRTEGYRHGSIADGIAAIQELGAEAGFQVEATEDPARFTDEGLRGLSVVIFLNTTGDVLDPPQELAFERFVRGGGGFVGVHAATDTEYDWPWYGELVGAYFARHPRVQEASVDVVRREHPSTRHLDTRWTRRDEWYDFRDDPSARVTVLLNLDEGTYEGGGMGPSHPIAWYHEHDGGRAWYTAMGHTAETYREPAFRAHLRGGILWAAGAAPATAMPSATATREATPAASATPTPAARLYLPWLSRRPG